MIHNQDWLMIKHLHQQGVPKARIARKLGIDRKTVAKAIEQDTCPKHQGRRRGSILDPYKEYLQQRLSKYDLTATRLLREIKEQGYPGSYTIVKDYVREVKGDRPSPAYVRFETSPGEQAQVDWADFGWLGDDSERVRLWCFSMVLGYSRMLYIEFMSSQNLVHLCQSHVHAFRYLGGVTEHILYDNMATVVLSREGTHIHWNPKFSDFASHYGFLPRLCLPGRKETKGKVERPFSYIRSSFFNGSQFSSLEELNTKARHWLETVANVRVHATTQAVPSQRLTEEALQPVRPEDYIPEPVETRKSTKDCYFSFEGNRYSVPFEYACRELTIKLQGETVHVFHGDTPIATHTLSHQKGQMITNPDHFVGIPKPAYPTGMRAIREVFLAHFPQSGDFLDGLVAAKYGNARYHLRQILSLMEDYPAELVQQAIDRANQYGAFDSAAIRNICAQHQRPQHQHHSQVPELTHKNPVVTQTVQERALSDYTRFDA